MQHLCSICAAPHGHRRAGSLLLAGLLVFDVAVDSGTYHWCRRPKCMYRSSTQSCVVQCAMRANTGALATSWRCCCRQKRRHLSTLIETASPCKLAGRWALKQPSAFKPYPHETLTPKILNPAFLKPCFACDVNSVGFNRDRAACPATCTTLRGPCWLRTTLCGTSWAGSRGRRRWLRAPGCPSRGCRS